MNHNVTVGVDGTRESVAAADWAAREALSRDVPLQLLQVRETGAYPYSPIIDDEVEREWARKVTREAAEELTRRHPGLRTTVEMVSGRPAHVFADISSQTDLLVLGSRGLSSVLGFFVGSSALTIVGHAACPVVLVRAHSPDADDQAAVPGPDSGAQPRPPHDVVLGVDLDHSSDEVISFAFDAASRRSATLRVLYAWGHLPATHGVRPVPVPPSLTSELLAEQSEAVRAVVQPWQQKFPDVTVEARAVIGHPAHLLVDAASEASLLVIGRRTGHPRLGTHTGAATHAVLHHAHVPVAVVPHG